MSQARNRRRLASKSGSDPDTLGLAIKQIQVIAEGLTIAHNGVMSVIRDVTQLRAVVHEVARRAGMTDEEIAAIASADVDRGTDDERATQRSEGT